MCIYIYKYIYTCRYTRTCASTLLYCLTATAHTSVNLSQHNSARRHCDTRRKRESGALQTARVAAHRRLEANQTQIMNCPKHNVDSCGVGGGQLEERSPGRVPWLPEKSCVEKQSRKLYCNHGRLQSDRGEEFV